jgi:hypothetical protein
MQLTEAATVDRKSGEAEGSAVPRTRLGNMAARHRADLSYSWLVVYHRVASAAAVGPPSGRSYS